MKMGSNTRFAFFTGADHRFQPSSKLTQSTKTTISETGLPTKKLEDMVWGRKTSTQMTPAMATDGLEIPSAIMVKKTTDRSRSVITVGWQRISRPSASSDKTTLGESTLPSAVWKCCRSSFAPSGPAGYVNPPPPAQTDRLRAHFAALRTPHPCGPSEIRSAAFLSAAPCAAN